jgi:hypothetical protein
MSKGIVVWSKGANKRLNRDKIFDSRHRVFQFLDRYSVPSKGAYYHAAVADATDLAAEDEVAIPHGLDFAPRFLAYQYTPSDDAILESHFYSPLDFYGRTLFRLVPTIDEENFYIKFDAEIGGIAVPEFYILFLIGAQDISEPLDT